VDRYVDDIAYTFGVGRDALNVVCSCFRGVFSKESNRNCQVAAAKGLVVGSFAITKKDKSVIDYSVEPEVSDHPHQDMSYDLRKVGLVGSRQQGD